MDDSMDSTAVTKTPDIARISPELVLVDPELARRVRRRVPQKRLGHRPPLPVLRLPAVLEPGGDAVQHAAAQ